MKVSELREMHDEELYNKLAEFQQELFNLRFQHVTGQLDNYARLRQVRRDIARAQTILREREIEAADAEDAARARAALQGGEQMDREMAATSEELSDG